MKMAGIAFAASAMGRREFIALAGASVTWPFAVLAQEARTYRLGAASARCARKRGILGRIATPGFH